MKTDLIIAVVISLIVMSCKDKAVQDDKSDDSGFIEISKAQYDSEKMVIGEPELYPFADMVHFTGIIIPSVSGRAQISLPLPGIVGNIRCEPTEAVRKGSVLFEISGNHFVDLQKDFAESSAILSKLKSDYIRVKELYDDNVSTQKEFIAAESKYKAENARYMALKNKLESMSLDVDKIETGEFYLTFPVKSPINGFVANINASVGQYVDPQITIAELIDDNSFQLKLSVFEKDINKIKIGQSVAFYLNGNNKVNYKASISAIGKTIMPDSRSIECYAEIEKPKTINMVSNQFVEGDIFTQVDSALAIPESAILQSESETYVLVYEKSENTTYFFKPLKVNIGRRAVNYIELTEQLRSKKILVEGAYNIVLNKE